MQVNKLSNKSNTGFGVNITTETVIRANRALIEQGKLARRQGLTLKEFNTLDKEYFVHRFGSKTFDFHDIAEKLLANKEKVKKIFGEAWDKVIGKK